MKGQHLKNAALWRENVLKLGHKHQADAAQQLELLARLFFSQQTGWMGIARTHTPDKVG